MPPKPKKGSASQEFVSIKEIKDGVVIMDDDSLRAVIMTSSINFALKSEDERNAILYQFQNFLNTLDFSIQIQIQSRRLDIEPYLNLLNEQYEKQDNELLKIQIKEYVEFVKDFTNNVNIMTKSFFLVIPYYSFFQTRSSAGWFNFLSKGDTQEQKERSFDQQKMQLEQRVSIVEQGLTRVGLRTKKLDDEELTELYHSIFNPEDKGGGINQ